MLRFARIVVCNKIDIINTTSMQSQLAPHVVFANRRVARLKAQIGMTRTAGARLILYAGSAQYAPLGAWPVPTNETERPASDLARRDSA